MTKENTGTNDVTDQPVTGQDVSQPVTGEGVEPQVAAEEGVSQPATEEKTVPYSRLQEVIAQKDAEKAQAEAYRQQLAIAQANPPQQQQEPPVDYRKQVLQQLGLADKEWLTPEEQVTVTQAVVTAVAAQQSHNSFLAAHPDIDQIVGTRNPQTGYLTPAKPLQKLIAEDPSKAYLLQPQFTTTAYEMAKMRSRLDELETQTAAQKEHQAEVDIANKTQTMSAAGAGGAGAGVPSDVAIENMTGPEILALAQKAAGGGFG